MFKKTSALLCFIICILTIFVGCGDDKNAEIAGEWVPVTATLNGETVQYGELGLEDNQFGLVFNSNGTCTTTLAGISSDGTYTFNETSIDVIINEDHHKLNYEKGIITYSLDYYSNSMSLTFTKVKSNWYVTHNSV